MNAFIVSDFHLAFEPETNEERERNRAVLNFLSHIRDKADMLIMNGDIFDLWYDWKSTIIKGYFPVLKKLADLKENNCKLVFIAGNHDFWFNDFFAKYLDCEIHMNSFTATLDGKKLFVAHGDQYTLNDHRYHIFRFLVRHPLTRFFFSLLHPDVALRIGRSMSRTSRKRNKANPDSDARRKKGLEEFAGSIADQHDIIVLGHSHSPGHIALNGSCYFNSGDWVKNLSYVKIIDGKAELCYWLNEST